MAEISDEIKACITEIHVTIDRVDVDLTTKYETIRSFVASIDQAQQQMVVNNIVNFYIDRLLRSDLHADRWKPILQKVILYTYVFITFFMKFFNIQPGCRVNEELSQEQFPDLPHEEFSSAVLPVTIVFLKLIFSLQIRGETIEEKLVLSEQKW